jgi:hypothetical protein
MVKELNLWSEFVEAINKIVCPDIWRLVRSKLFECDSFTWGVLTNAPVVIKKTFVDKINSCLAFKEVTCWFFSFWTDFVFSICFFCFLHEQKVAT